MLERKTKNSLQTCLLYESQKNKMVLKGLFDHATRTSFCTPFRDTLPPCRISHNWMCSFSKNDVVVWKKTMNVLTSFHNAAQSIKKNTKSLTDQVMTAFWRPFLRAHLEVERSNWKVHCVLETRQLCLACLTITYKPHPTNWDPICLWIRLNLPVNLPLHSPHGPHEHWTPRRN